MLVCIFLPSATARTRPRVRHAPGVPSGLTSRRGKTKGKARAPHVARTQNCLNGSASEAKQSIHPRVTMLRHGLLRFARNDVERPRVQSRRVGKRSEAT